jgi:predicted methyltransferase
MRIDLRSEADLKQTRRPLAVIGALAGMALLAAGLAPPASAQGAPDYGAIVAAPDRSDADRETDRRRDPVKLLNFTGVRPGMKVLDMGAGGGYSTELMARAVGPNGVVYGQNPADLFPRPKERFEARMKTPAMKNVVAVTRPFDDPLPPDQQKSRSHHLLFLLPRHDLHGGRPRPDEPQAFCRAQAGRPPGDR